MKKIEAYIKPHKLPDVTRAMHGIPDLHGMSVLDCRGFGRGKVEGSKSAGHTRGFDYAPHLKIEIFCGDSTASEVVDAIEKAAHTGLRGDGKIFATAFQEAVRISTGERGGAVV